MPRNIDAAALAELDNRGFRYAFFVHFEFDSGDLAFCSLTRPVTWNSVTYVGGGNLGKVGSIQESTGADPRTCPVTMSAVNDTFLAAILAEKYLNRQATIRLGLLDENEQLVGDPFIYFWGQISDLRVTYGKRAEAVFTITDRLALWSRPKVRRYTNQEQQKDHPGDLGMEFAEKLASADIEWPTRAYLKKIS